MSHRMGSSSCACEALETRVLFATVTFQQGMNGYAATFDTHLRDGSPTTSYGNEAVVIVSGDDDGDVVHGLLKFDDLFGSGPGQVPVGATITGATLTVRTDNGSKNSSSIHRMLTSWNESSTWNSLTGGVSANGTEAASAADGSVVPSTVGASVNINVTATVQAWANNPSANQGWAFLSSGSNSWEYNSSEASTASYRPRLSITYEGQGQPPTNQAPTVSAGNDASVTLPNAANLNGTVNDDGLPAGSLTTTWSRTSGPSGGTVTFGNASAVDTTATFSQAGTYVLRLTATDGQLTTFDEVTITVSEPGQPTNAPPSVNAGNNATITLPDFANLNGTVTDDGLPAGTLTTTWSRTSGPSGGTVTFGSASAVDTTATFSQPGTYVLRLTASDGQLSAFDEVTITVEPEDNDPEPPPPTSTQELEELGLDTDTGEKPQSKVWKHDGAWWGAFSADGGTFVWKLVGNSWQQVLQISDDDAHADVKPAGNVAHILLYEGSTSHLASVQYVNGTYQMWSQRSSLATVPLGSGVETATIDIDASGRAWVAYEAGRGIHVRYSDGNYSSWSSPITLATGVRDDDIASVIAMPDGSVGVMWSNQSTDRFGFRRHAAGAAPGTWGSLEIPAPGAAKNVGGGMADDHINLKVSSNGTVYAVIKTSYDRSSETCIGLLVRRPNGSWDNQLYRVATDGTRGILVLNEPRNQLMAVYTQRNSGGNIYYRTSSMSSISFGSQQTMLSGSSLNNASSSKHNVSTDVVVVAADNGEDMSGKQFVWSGSSSSSSLASTTAGTSGSSLFSTASIGEAEEDEFVIL